MVLKCRSDFEFSDVDHTSEEVPSISDDRPSSTATDEQAADHFSHEEINDHTDPVLELHMTSPLQPLLHSSPDDSLLPGLPQLPSPDEEVGEEMDIDLKSQEGVHIFQLQALLHVCMRD